MDDQKNTVEMVGVFEFPRDGRHLFFVESSDDPTALHANFDFHLDAFSRWIIKGHWADLEGRRVFEVEELIRRR